MKLMVTLLVKAATECVSGVDNLFASGKDKDPKTFPDYGQYVPKHEFQAFMYVLPFLWADEEFWYRDPRTLPWEVMMPFVTKVNALRAMLMHVLYMVLDETMWGWRPKTSVTGGFPNITHEPRKPVDLGAMARNAVEAITGIMVFQDPVADLTSQRLKNYMQEDNVLHTPEGAGPEGGRLPVHVAEVLRQVDGSRLQKGGWVCGDAWFGSVTSVVELMIRKGVYSSECCQALLYSLHC